MGTTSELEVTGGKVVRLRLWGDNVGVQVLLIDDRGEAEGAISLELLLDLLAAELVVLLGDHHVHVLTVFHEVTRVGEALDRLLDWSRLVGLGRGVREILVGHIVGEGIMTAVIQLLTVFAGVEFVAEADFWREGARGGGVLLGLLTELGVHGRC